MKQQKNNIITRLNAVCRKLKSESADVMLVTNEEDVCYLSGFTGDSSWLVVSKNWTCLITDGRYDEQARAECEGIDIFVRDSMLPEALVKVIRGKKAKKIAFQAEYMTVSGLNSLEKTCGKRKWIPTTGILAGLRIIKDESEIKLIAKAGKIAQNAFIELISGGCKFFIGKTERQIAAELIYLLRQNGAEEEAFAPIVAAGANGSMPHYRPSGVKIKKDDPILFDWGARYKGYRSDLTRVVFLGTIRPEIEEMYRVVLCAQKAGMQSLKPGLLCKTADAAGRSVIEQAGYGSHFSHSLGHGIGRDIHEGPNLSSKSSQRLRKGMVVTVEPGIYIPGIGGVRIEDDMVVTTDAARRITKLKSDLDSMVLQ